MDALTIANWFTYHSPTEEQVPKYEAIRREGLHLAGVINDSMPDCPDKTAAIRKVREAVMTANAGLSCGGK
jgi:hypothetical protein